MSLKELQEELIDIISTIIIESDDKKVNTEQKRASEIISKLKDHINDKIEKNNMRMTILDWIIFCDSQDGKRLNNRSLLELEKTVKSIGEKSERINRRESRSRIETRGDYRIILLMSFCLSFSLASLVTCITLSTLSVENSLTYGLIASTGISAILAIASIAKLVHYVSFTNLENVATEQINRQGQRI